MYLQNLVFGDRIIECPGITTYLCIVIGGKKIMWNYRFCSYVHLVQLIFRRGNFKKGENNWHQPDWRRQCFWKCETQDFTFLSNVKEIYWNKFYQMTMEGFSFYIFTFSPLISFRFFFITLVSVSCAANLHKGLWSQLFCRNYNRHYSDSSKWSCSGVN